MSTTSSESPINTIDSTSSASAMVFRDTSTTTSRFLRSLRFFFQVRGRVKKNSVLYFTLSGSIPDTASQSPSFNPLSLLSGASNRPISLSQLTNSLRLAAHDPRISAIYFRIEPLSCGYAKLQEIRRFMDYFKQSGKKIYAYLEIGSEKEFYLASGCNELYMPPEAFFGLRGFRVSGSFLKGVFEKIGIEPQVERIGVYKSAGDQFARKSMSDAQREVLSALLEEQYKHFMKDIVNARKLESENVLEEILNRAPQKAEEYAQAGLISGVKYEDELIESLKKTYNKNGDVEKPLRSVALAKYARRTTPKLIGLDRGKDVIGIIRANGAIASGQSRRSALSGSENLGSESLIQLLRAAGRNKSLKAVVLRVDSPGGSALASDVMWREIKKLREKIPVVASMGDVAASGGYYLSMGCDEIVAEELTLTGSIGVVTAKLSLEKLYEKIGFVRENISKGKYAELDVDNRGFSKEEKEYFENGAQKAYLSFTSKAAESRGMELTELQKVAQGRVWTGKQALDVGLVDKLGGIWTAIASAKSRAGIDQEKSVKIVELRAPSGFFARPAPFGASLSQSIISGQPLAITDTVLPGLSSNISPLECIMLESLSSQNPELLSQVIMPLLNKSLHT
eukprot:CAMPEP_0182442032 /NCGR_PEP_ID=MMETSP1172-20130603/1015_1 /TAXON_ID=708627 /ORGANISM="Timspurckia oligopyrenoides, Strain CCMP3278" /LENGTH=623 /DNA_ID=CAMNT_0024636709 /DNA_START=158 /DNA_END=2029 /DNA_ORIENTATION=+